MEGEGEGEGGGNSINQKAKINAIIFGDLLKMLTVLT